MGKTNRFHSPLRYPGGKTRLAPFIKEIFYENKLVGCDYIEPYAGGAGVALSLLFDEYVNTVTINDYDRSVYAFWHSIIHKGDQFCRKLLNTPVTVESWRRQKKIQDNKSQADLFSLGFSTFFLNRTNVSGVVKGGVIGGLNQQGRYKIDARFKKSNLIKKIKKIREYKDRINIKNCDALDILKSDIKNSFVYLDPPYVKKAKGLYMNFYNEKNHCEIARFLLSDKPGFQWLLSYDQNELIRNLYKSCKTSLPWNLGYGSSNRKSREYIFVKQGLKVKQSKEILA